MPGGDELGDFGDDEANLNRDAHTRRRYLQWFNKRRADFDTDRAHDDYLEMVEDVIYKLVNGIDVEATKALITKYRKENSDSINTNAALRHDEQRKMLDSVNEKQRERLQKLADKRAEDEAREAEIMRKKRVADAEELVRATHGEEEYKKVVKTRKKKEKKEMRKKKEDEIDATATQHWYRVLFPSLPPAVVGGTPANGAIIDETNVVPRDDSNVAAAAGFQTEELRKRARAEFEQSFPTITT